MVWRHRGGISRLYFLRWDECLQASYVIKVVNMADLAPEVKEMIHDFSSAIKETRARRLARIGEDVAVQLEIEN